MTSYTIVITALLFIVCLLYGLAFVVKKLGIGNNILENKGKLFTKVTLAKGYAIIKLNHDGKVQEFLETPYGVCVIKSSENDCNTLPVKMVSNA